MINGWDLFYKKNYAPHFAENFYEDGREYLLLADPHQRNSFYLYDVVQGEIVFEKQVTNGYPNPHTVRILNKDLKGIGHEGDYMVAGEGVWHIFDKHSLKEEFRFKLPDTKWVHEFFLSKDEENFIVSDYLGGWVKKVSPKGKVIWTLDLSQFGPVGKITRVEGKAKSGVHSSTFADEDYLVVVNSNPYGVFAINDDGKILYSIPQGVNTLNNFWCNKPHSAYRKGLAEMNGNLTIIGFEGGGGFVALDSYQRPKYGISKGITTYPFHYTSTKQGLMETTHVFPTVRGNIGLIDWSGEMSSKVWEIESFDNSRLTFIWAWDYQPKQIEKTFLYPSLDVQDYDDVVITIIPYNGKFDVELYTTKMPHNYEHDFPKCWAKKRIESISDYCEISVPKHTTFINLALTSLDSDGYVKVLASYS